LQRMFLPGAHHKAVASTQLRPIVESLCPLQASNKNANKAVERNAIDLVRRSLRFSGFRHSLVASLTLVFENEIIDMDEDTHKKLDKIIELLSEIKENTDPMNPWNDVGSKIGYLDDEVKKIVEILKEKK
jgi:hypothetical protein